MLTEVLILEVLGSLAQSAAEGLVVHKGAALLSRLNSDARFQNAIREDNEQALELLRLVVIAVARVVSGRSLSGDEAFQVLLNLLTDPTTRRRLSALRLEGFTSTDERIAMLAVGYFVGGQEAAMRERLDWAIRGLFPEDADTLSKIVDVDGQLQKGEHLVLVQGSRDHDDGVWRVNRAVAGTPLPDEGALAAAQSLRALATAQCIVLVEPPAGPVVTWQGPPKEIGPVRQVELLPLGRQLHEILRTVDWREIARRRKAG